MRKIKKATGVAQSRSIIRTSEVFRSDNAKYSVEVRSNARSAVVVDESVVGMRLGGTINGTKTRRLNSRSGALEHAKELSYVT